MLHGVDDLMPIGEFSERSGLSPKRLRSYATSGLLVPTAVDSSTGYRFYAPGQLREARLIDALRSGGMPLADIAQLLRDPSVDAIDGWMRQLELEAAQRQEALETARQMVDPTGKGTMTKLQTAARTETGPVRAHNEDATLCRGDLVAVADGMGGGPGGEVAAAAALDLIESAFTGASLDELAAGVRAANRSIWDRACASTELEGMGTTVCAVGVTDTGELAVVNVGDSRAYLWRDGRLRQLTDDHSVTAELVRRGELAEPDAADHPHRNVLTRVLGVAPEVLVDGVVQPAVAGDRLLLCTDGLFHDVPDDELASLMAATADLQAAADGLVDAALARGGRDNVSVIVAEVSS
jgi:serine/threonine protein phosphatase PrpC